MRLLNTTTLRIVHFPNPDTRPPYAILSHVWQGNETSYHDVHSLRTHSEPFSAAPEKVRRFCAFARADGLEWAWLDACCIDKASSSELSEALNSMFRWYQDAVVCYAYLHDVPAPIDNSPMTLAGLEENVVESVWFTRGWTLQELLAPRFLIFVSSEWTAIGTKHSLAPAIHRATGIDLKVLSHIQPLHRVSIARRMSWAARRRTTRPEDRAYSLMGIFGVNMVTLYGEGLEKAFYRLQEEILKYCRPDQSLFAWGAFDLSDVLSRTFRQRLCGTLKDPIHNTAGPGRLLAPSPDCFAHAGSIVRVSHARVAEFLGMQLPTHSIETNITGFGIRVTLPLIPFHTHLNIAFLAVLACHHSSFPDSLMCLYLGRSITVRTSPLYPVGAFTLAFPHNVGPAISADTEPPVRPLHRKRGGSICLPLRPKIRKTIIIPTIYLVHNSSEPGHSPWDSRDRLICAPTVQMYVAATPQADPSRRPSLTLLPNRRVAFRAHLITLSLRLIRLLAALPALLDLFRRGAVAPRSRMILLALLWEESVQFINAEFVQSRLRSTDSLQTWFSDDLLIDAHDGRCISLASFPPHATASAMGIRWIHHTVTRIMRTPRKIHGGLAYLNLA